MPNKKVEKDIPLTPGVNIARAYSYVAITSVLSFGLLFYFFAVNMFMSAVLLTTALLLVIDHIMLRRTGNYERTIQVILTLGVVVMTLLFATGGWGNTGYLWPLAFLPFVILMSKRKNANYWTFALFGGCLGAVGLSALNIIHVPYSPVALFNFFAALTTFIVFNFVYQKSTVDYEDFLSYSNSLLEANTDPFFTINTDGKIADVNKAAEKYTGIDRADLLDSAFESYFAEPQKAKEIYKNVFSDGLARNFPLTLKHKSGKLIPVIFNAAIYRDESTMTDRVFATARDVTELTVAEKALGKTEERLQIALDGMEAGLWEWNTKEDKRWWSPLYFELLGYKYNEIEPSLETLKSLVHPDDLELLLKSIKDTLVEEGRFNIAIRYKTKAGDYKWFRVHGKTVFDETGKPLRMVGTIIDIDKHRKADILINQQAALIQILPDGIIYGDITSKITNINAGAEKMFEMTADEARGKTVDDIMSFKLKGTTREANRIELATKGFVRMEAEVTNRNGKTMQVLGSVKMVVNADSLPGWVAIYTDISPLKLNEELKEALKKLETNNQYMEQLAYISAHDIKSPIIALEGLSDILINSNAVKPEYAEVLKMFKNTINQMQRTNHSLNNILKLRKNLLRKEDVSDQSFSLQSIIEDVKTTLQNNLDEAKATVEVDMDGVSEVHFPYVHIKSIFFNLLTNAIKYRDPKRPLTINIKAKKEGDNFSFIVQDNGLGMNLNLNKDKLFGIFKRFHDHVEGTGVGLHIVKSIVDAYGGTIEVESAEGKGTSFKISFNNTITV